MKGFAIIIILLISGCINPGCSLLNSHYQFMKAKAYIASLDIPEYDKSYLIKALRQLENEDPELRSNALSAIYRYIVANDHAIPFEAKAVASEKVPLLMKLLIDDNINIRIGAAIVLPFIDSSHKEAIPVLIESLEKREGATGAAESLKNFNGDALEALPYLIDFIKTTDCVPQNSTVQAAYQAIQYVGIGEEAIDQLIDALDEDNLTVRTAVMLALKKNGSIALRAAPMIAEQTKDSNYNIRIIAAMALGSFGADAANTSVPVLIKLLDDENEVVCWTAIEALEQIGPPAQDAVPKLLHILNSGEPFIQKFCPDALVSILAGGPVDSLAMQILKYAAEKNEYESVRDAAKRAIKKLESDNT